MPTISAASGLRTGSAIKNDTKKVCRVFGKKAGKELMKNGSTKTNVRMLEFMMGFPLGWTSLKALKKIIIPKWNLINLKKFKPIKPVKYNKERVHAIGNAQVPICVYNILTTLLPKDVLK